MSVDPPFEPDRFVCDRIVTQDARTGREVWQVTSGGGESVSPYMDCVAWSSDDRFLVVNCNRTGSWQPYRLEIDTGEMVQLCPVELDAYRSVALAIGNDTAYCADGARVWAVELDTLAVREAVNWRPYFPPSPSEGKARADAVSLNRGGALVVRSTITDDGEIGFIMLPTDGTGAAEILRVPRPGNRPHFCLGDDNVISFHGKPDVQSDRNETPENRVADWRITRDTGELAPLCAVPPGYRAIHCLWGVSGERFYIHKKTAPGFVPTSLGSFDRSGGDYREYFTTSDHRLGHCSPSPGERWLVTDSQDFEENILMLVHLERDEQHLLCWPNSSIKQPRPHKRNPDLPPHTDTDIHPNFSRTGRMIAYNSDISGRSQVYVVPVGDILQPGD